MTNSFIDNFDKLIETAEELVLDDLIEFLYYHEAELEKLGDSYDMTWDELYDEANNSDLEQDLYELYCELGIDCKKFY